jgi:hypothetical protein
MQLLLVPDVPSVIMKLSRIYEYRNEVLVPLNICHYIVQVFVLRCQEHEESEVRSVDIRLSSVNELLRLIKALRERIQLHAAV